MKTFPDIHGNSRPFPEVKGTVCDHRADLSVTLIQQDSNRFAVIYGLQSKTGLTYKQAASEYGLCVMHALSCMSLVRLWPEGTDLMNLAYNGKQSLL